MKEVIKDTRPIYLGYCKQHKKYYFYAIKGSAPRFLTYVSYFYWDMGPQTALVIEPIPEGLEQELEQFLQGTITYEFFKRRKNSKSQEVRKIFRLPIEVSGPAEQQDSRGKILVPDTGHGDRDGRIGNTIPTDTTSAQSHIGNEGLPKQRRTRRPRLAEPVELTPQAGLEEPSPGEALLKFLRDKSEASTKPKRGRPKQIKETL